MKIRSALSVLVIGLAVFQIGLSLIMFRVAGFMPRMNPDLYARFDEAAVSGPLSEERAKVVFASFSEMVKSNEKFYREVEARAKVLTLMFSMIGIAVIASTWAIARSAGEASRREDT